MSVEVATEYLSAGGSVETQSRPLGKQADAMRMNRLLQLAPPDAYGICCGAPGATVREAAVVTDIRG